MQYLFENHDSILYTLAGIMLILELTVLGMSGPLLFVSIGCVISGVLISAGVLSTWEMEVLAVAIISLITALLLWKPLKKIQGEDKVVSDTSSDMIGQIVKASSIITISDGTIRYSGIDWQARLARDSDINQIDESQSVEIIAVDGTTMLVKTLS